MKKTPRKVVRMINVKNTKKIRRKSNVRSQRKVDRRSHRKVDRRSQRKVDRRSQRKVDRRSQRKRINRTIKKNRNMIRIINGGARTAFLDAVRGTHIEDHENIINKILSLSDLTNDKDKEIFGKLFSVIPIEEDGGNVKFYVEINRYEISENTDNISAIIKKKNIVDEELIYDKGHFSTDFTKLKEEAYLTRFLDGDYELPLTFIVNLLKVIGNDLFKLYKEELGAEMNVLVAEEDDEEGDQEDDEEGDDADTPPLAVPSVAFGNDSPPPVVPPPASPSVAFGNAPPPPSVAFGNASPPNDPGKIFTEYLINYIRLVLKTNKFKRSVNKLKNPPETIIPNIISDPTFNDFTRLILEIPQYLKNVIVSIKPFYKEANNFLIESEGIIDNIISSINNYFTELSDKTPETKWFFITVLSDDTKLHTNIKTYLNEYCNAAYSHTKMCDKPINSNIKESPEINQTIEENDSFKKLVEELTLSNPIEMLKSIQTISVKQYNNNNAWERKLNL